MHFLGLLCPASSQNINTKKTHIFFSKNVVNQFQYDIIQHTSFFKANNLEKYLGANISSEITSVGNFYYIAQKISKHINCRVEQRSGSGLDSAVCMKPSIQFRDPISPTN